MKKQILFIIAIILVPVFIFIIRISLLVIEDYIIEHNYYIWIYNYTNDDIDISINNKNLKTIEGRTFVMDKIFSKNIKTYNYKIRINGNIILDKELNFQDISKTYSARGGSITEIIISNLDTESYEIIFLSNNNAKENNYLELKLIHRKKIRDIFL